MKLRILFTLCTIIYFSCFYLVNDRGYKETSRSENIVQFVRYGFPFDAPYSFNLNNLNSDQVEKKRLETHSGMTFWLHAHNGVYWFGVYFIICWLGLLKLKKKVTQKKQLLGSL